MKAIKKFIALLLLALISTSAFAITDTQLFDWAAAIYPQFFSGTPTVGQYQQYDYRYYPETGIYLAVETTSSTVYALGAITGNALLPLGSLTDFAPAVTSWQKAQRLSKVNSFMYVIGVSTNGTVAGNQTILNAVWSSPVDLVILSNIYEPITTGIANPSPDKLVIGYMDPTECAGQCITDLINSGVIVNNTPPSWFGNPNPAFLFGGSSNPIQNLYSVQYWNPVWQQEVYFEIDRLIADGYYGVFLDVLDGDNEWAAGNIEGNPVNPNATAQLATLVQNIYGYIQSKNLNRPFYVIGNNPKNIGRQFPSSLNSLDVIFNEVAFWTREGNFTTTGSIPNPNGSAALSYSANIYSGRLVFGNDYPPLNTTTHILQSSDVLQSFFAYSALGWLPSVQQAGNPPSTLSTGPFEFMATSASPTVHGADNFTNYISGGLVQNATLIGGNSATNYFLGGPGINSIQGGTGNDTIYAHPASSYLNNILDIQFSSTIKGVTTTPSISVKVNGITLISPTAITAQYNSATQDFQISLAGIGTISSLEVDVTGASFKDQSNFSNIEIVSMTANGKSIDLSQGTYSNGSGPANFAGNFFFSNNGSVKFPGSAFSNAPSNTNIRDTINGGGGTDTVIYQGNAADYSIVRNADGSIQISSAKTGIGPDILTNIQTVQFSDTTVTLSTIH